MNDVLITGTGLWTPEFGVTNEELVESLSQAVEKWNAEHAAEIESGALEQRDFPSVKFIQKVDEAASQPKAPAKAPATKGKAGFSFDRTDTPITCHNDA